MKSLFLGVNIDHVATLRNVRGADYPDPLMAAFLAEQAGADSITVHLREDRRHIRDADVLTLKQHLKTHLNLEIATTAEMLAIACTVCPQTVCLVPEKRHEMTTESGLDVIGQGAILKDAIAQLQQAGIWVSVFIDADLAQIEAAKNLGADAIELHTGTYANACFRQQREELNKLSKAATFADSLGLTVNAGHGLTYHNVQPIAALPELYELNIGHAIVARALMTGMEGAVRHMKQLL